MDHKLFKKYDPYLHYIKSKLYNENFILTCIKEEKDIFNKNKKDLNYKILPVTAILEISTDNSCILKNLTKNIQEYNNFIMFETDLDFLEGIYMKNTSIVKSITIQYLYIGIDINVEFSIIKKNLEIKLLIIYH